MAETITVTYSAGSFTKSRTVPNGTGTRIIAAGRTRLKLAGTLTNAQVFDALADEFITNVMENTQNTERETARATADAGIVLIVIT